MNGKACREEGWTGLQPTRVRPTLLRVIMATVLLKMSPLVDTIFLIIAAVAAETPRFLSFPVTSIGVKACPRQLDLTVS